MKLPFELNKQRKLSDEDIEHILSLYKFGETISSLARIYNVDRNTIYHHVWKVFNPKRFYEIEQLKMKRNRKLGKGKREKELERLAKIDRKNRLIKAFGKKKVIQEFRIKDRINYLKRKSL